MLSFNTDTRRYHMDHLTRYMIWLNYLKHFKYLARKQEKIQKDLL